MEETLNSVHSYDYDKINTLINRITNLYTVNILNSEFASGTTPSDNLGKIQSLCEEFSSINFQDIPVNILEEEVYPLLTQILNFIVYLPNNLHTEKTYNDILKLYKNSYTTLTPIINYHKKLNIDHINKKFDQLYKKIQLEHEEFVNKEKQIEAKQKLLLEQSEKLTENLGISSYAKYFQDEAKNHNIKSQLWVIITFSIAVATILFAIGGHIYLPDIPGDTLTPKYISQVLAPKATVLAILIYMLTWSVKNQKSHNHNYIVNNHRKNALETFQAFVLSSEGTPEIKHAMLMQMTNCIFNHQNSSYTVAEKEPDIANKLLDLVKPSTKGS